MLTDEREKDYRLSVVIPVYNVKPDFLRCCIDSVLSNSSSGIEVVIVDDRSTNGCEILCDEYGRADSRIKVIHQAINAGVSAARNTGVKEARGEWILFVDSDDWMEAGYLETVSDHMISDIEVIMFSAIRESVNVASTYGTSDGVVLYSEDQGAYDLSELRDRMLKQNLLSTHPRYDTVKYCWGKVFRRAFLIENDITFPDLNYCEDIVFMSRVFQKAAKVIQIPDRLYHYRVTENSAVNSYRPNALEEQRRFVDLLQGSADEDTMLYAALLSMQICITRYLYHKDNKKGLLSKHREANRHFSEYPYSEVFRRLNWKDMKRAEKIKAFLIKHRQYFLYYEGTQIMRSRATRF